MELLFTPFAGVIALIIVAAIILWIWAKVLYRNVSPDEAIVVTGKRSRRRVVDGVDTEESGQRVVHGQGVWIMPFFQKAHKISLRSRAIEIRAEAQTNNGITVHVDAVAIVKVGDSAASIRAAAQRFLGQDKNIDMFAQEVLSGSLRASIGATDVLTIINRRDELSSAVLGVARESLVNQGLDVDSFEIKGISDTNGYIDDLGRAEQAKVRKQAEIAEAEAQREAREAVIAAEQTVAEREAGLAQRKAALQRETDKATAEAAAARPLAEALSQQEVVAQQEITAQKKAALRAAELDSEVKAVADAQAYKVKVEAEAAAGRRAHRRRGRPHRPHRVGRGAQGRGSRRGRRDPGTRRGRGIRHEGRGRGRRPAVRGAAADAPHRRAAAHRARARRADVEHRPAHRGVDRRRVAAREERRARASPRSTRC